MHARRPLGLQVRLPCAVYPPRAVDQSFFLQEPTAAVSFAALPLPVKDAAVRVCRTAAAVPPVLVPAAAVLAADIPEHAKPALFAAEVAARIHGAAREYVDTLAVHFATGPRSAVLGAMTPLHAAEAVRRPVGNLALVLVAVFVDEHADARGHAAHHVARVHEAGAVADAPPPGLLVARPLSVVARAVGALEHADARSQAVRPRPLEERPVGVRLAAVAVRAAVALRANVPRGAGGGAGGGGGGVGGGAGGVRGGAGGVRGGAGGVRDGG